MRGGVKTETGMPILLLSANQSLLNSLMMI
jgi:hypothetical protein